MNCGKEITRYKHEVWKKYCSNSCRREKLGIYKNCLNCKKEIYVRKAEIDSKKYCSKTCMDEFIRNKQTDKDRYDKKIMAGKIYREKNKQKAHEYYLRRKHIITIQTQIYRIKRKAQDSEYEKRWSREYWKKHPEEKKKNQKKYREKNREKIRAEGRKYREKIWRENPEKCRMMHRKYYERHKEEINKRSRENVRNKTLRLLAPPGMRNFIPNELVTVKRLQIEAAKLLREATHGKIT
jgi:hypothetical protein